MDSWENVISNLEEKIQNNTDDIDLLETDTLKLTKNNIVENSYWHDDQTLHTNSDFSAIKDLITITKNDIIELYNTDNTKLTFRIRYKNENDIISFTQTDSFKAEDNIVYCGIYMSKSVGILSECYVKVTRYNKTINEEQSKDILSNKEEIENLKNIIGVKGGELIQKDSPSLTSSYFNYNFKLIKNTKYKLTISNPSNTNFRYIGVRGIISEGVYDNDNLIGVVYSGNLSSPNTIEFVSVNDYIGLRFYINEYTEPVNIDIELSNTYESTGIQKEIEDLDKTIICCWGSSSVEGYLGNKIKYVNNGSYNVDAESKMSFPRRLSSLINNKKYEIWNCGVGGEGIPTILSRMGSLPMYNDTEFILPANGDWVDIARNDNQTYLKSIFDDSIVVPNEAYNGNETYDAQSVLNPVYVNGIECTLELYSPTEASIVNNSGKDVFNNGAFRIKRNVTSSSSDTIPVGTVITPYAAKLFQSKNIIHIYLIGANGGWYNWEDFKVKVNKCIDWFGYKYIILGYHTKGMFNSYSENQTSKFNISIPSTDDFRNMEKKEYGLKFLDLRYLMSKRWFIDFAREYNLKIHYVSKSGAGQFNGNNYSADDISVIPSEYRDLLEEMPVEWKNNNLPSDIKCYNEEIPPTTLMADGSNQSSGQHCNFYGYEIMGHYIYNKLIELGYII